MVLDHALQDRDGLDRMTGRGKHSWVGEDDVLKEPAEFQNLKGGGMEIHDVYIMSRLKRIMSLENQVDGFNNFNVEKEC